MPGKQAKLVTPPMLRRMLRRVSRSSHPARDRAMILLSVKAGLRACEIAGLDWSMILDAQGRVSGTIHVRDVIAKNSGGTTDSHASQPAARSGAAGAHHRAGRPSDPLLPRRAPDGEQRRQLVRRALPRARLRGCSSHSGRRSFITMAARNVHRSGCSLRDVQLLAGHHSIETTRVRTLSSR
jgi:integrase